MTFSVLAGRNCSDRTKHDDNGPSATRFFRDDGFRRIFRHHTAAAPATPADSHTESASQSVPQAEAEAQSAAAPVAETDSVGARIREKMAAATEALPQPEETAAAPTSRRSGPVEIPKEDELEAELEAQIAAAMSGDIAVPAAVTAEAEPEDAAAGKEIAVGSKVKGVVQAIHGGEVFLEAGLLHNIVLQMTQFPEGKQPSVGDQLDVIIDSAGADGLIKGRIPRAPAPCRRQLGITGSRTGRRLPGYSRQ